MPYTVMQGDVQSAAEEERHCSVKLKADVEAATGALSTAGGLVCTQATEEWIDSRQIPFK